MAIWNPSQLNQLAGANQSGGVGNVAVYIGNEQLEGHMYRVATEVTGASGAEMARQQQKQFDYRMNRAA